MFSTLIPTLRRRLAVPLSLAAALAAGCGESTTESASADSGQTPPAEKSPGGNPALAIRSPASAEQPPTVDPLSDKPLVVPENASPDELVEFLRTTGAARVLGKTEEEYLAKAKQKATVVVTAADRILAAESTPVARYEAAANKFNALQDLRQLDAPEAEAQHRAFVAELPAIVADILKNPQTDAALRGQAISLKLNALFTSASQDEAAATAFLDELKLASADKDPGVVNVARQIDVHYQMARLMQEKETDPASLVAAVASAVAVDQPDPAFFDQAREIVSELEQSGHTGAAGQIADAVGAAYGRFDNEQLAEIARRWNESVKRRLNVVGSQIAIDGTLADGQPFDWPALRGKVVLVDFWATWCQPCLRLLPELEDLHARYRDEGFEIVGASLDNDRTALNQFLAQRKLPWPILANVAGKPETTPEQNADRFGVESIPFVILVDKRGKAVAAGLHGEALAARVKELLAE